MTKKGNNKHRSSILSYTIILTVYLFCCHFNTAISQNVVDTLNKTLTRADKYKLNKSIEFAVKGNKIMADLNSSVTSSNKNGTFGYTTNRILAAFCFRNANGALFEVLDNNIRAFRRQMKGKTSDLENIFKLENAMYDSLVKADGLREAAEYETYVDDKIPLVAKAENIESEALNKLSKILYVYIKYPEKPNMIWLDAKIQARPISKRNSNSANVDSVKYESILPKSPVRLSETASDNFDEFTKTNKSNKIKIKEEQLELMYDSIVNNVQKKWHRTTEFRDIFADTAQTIAFNKPKELPVQKTIVAETPKPAPIIVEKVQIKNIVFKIQIAAHKNKIPANMLLAIYNGNQKVSETYSETWYRYTIGNFTNFNEANEFLKKLNIKGAFTIAISDGKRIAITPEMKN